MMHPAELFRSVEHIWLLWLLAIALLVVLTRRILHGLSWQECRALLLREEGAAYSLSYVLTFPIYLLLICLIIESSLILLAKVGTVYAAYAGVRAAIVWESLDPSQADQKRDQAVTLALAPFASSNKLHVEGAGVSSSPSPQARHYAAAYQAHTHGKAPVGALMARYGYAEKAARAQTQASSADWDADVTVTVTYETPFTVPIIGRILGKRAPWPGARFYTYTIVSQATLQREAPKNPSQTLGIDYHVPN